MNAKIEIAAPKFDEFPYSFEEIKKQEGGVIAWLVGLMADLLRSKIQMVNQQLSLLAIVISNPQPNIGIIRHSDFKKRMKK